MAEIFMPSKREVAGTALALSVIAGGLVAIRQAAARKTGIAERLADALLETERLERADHHLPDGSAAALAECAAYLVHFANRAGEHLGLANATDDSVGYSRTQTHSYTRAVATVLTESDAPERILTYATNVPDAGEVRGTRRIGTRKISNFAPSRPTPDTVQITLRDGYTAQLESEFEVADYLIAGHARLFGQAMMRDNRGNVGRLHIAYDGAISGTITRDARVIGRFEGKVAHGLQFKQYQIESGD